MVLIFSKHTIKVHRYTGTNFVIFFGRRAGCMYELIACRVNTDTSNECISIYPCKIYILYLRWIKNKIECLYANRSIFDFNLLWRVRVFQSTPFRVLRFFIYFGLYKGHKKCIIKKNQNSFSRILCLNKNFPKNCIKIQEKKYLKKSFTLLCKATILKLHYHRAL